MVELVNVTKIYKGTERGVVNIRLKVEKGESVCIYGPTGAGKTTIMKLIYGEEEPSSGQIIVNGVDVNEISPKALARLRKGIGFVFQDLRLLMDRTIEENLMLGGMAAGIPGDALKEKVARALADFGMSGWGRIKVGDLSSGERKKVAVARALIGDPYLILADEPTSNLDESSTSLVLDILKRVNSKGATLLISTSDGRIPQMMGSRIVEIVDGKLKEG